MLPANAPVTFPYLATYRNGGTHKGVDLGTPQGTPLVAPVSGVVHYAGVGGGWGRAYGGQVIIRTDDLGPARWLLLAHMSRIDVQAGQRVDAGQRVGLSGGTPGTHGAGNSTGAHVHVQLNRSTRWDDHVDPWPALNHHAAGTRRRRFTGKDAKPMIYLAGKDHYCVYAHNGAWVAIKYNSEEYKNLVKRVGPPVWVTRQTLNEMIADGRGLANR